MEFSYKEKLSAVPAFFPTHFNGLWSTSVELLGILVCNFRTLIDIFPNSLQMTIMWTKLRVQIEDTNCRQDESLCMSGKRAGSCLYVAWSFWSKSHISSIWSQATSLLLQLQDASTTFTMRAPSIILRLIMLTTSSTVS